VVFFVLILHFFLISIHRKIKLTSKAPHIILRSHFSMIRLSSDGVKLVICSSIKSDGVKLVIWTKDSPLSELILHLIIMCTIFDS
jgi:hypothetical protein